VGLDRLIEVPLEREAKMIRRHEQTMIYWQPANRCENPAGNADGSNRMVRQVVGEVFKSFFVRQEVHESMEDRILSPARSTRQTGFEIAL
jgi:hypothetical protein